MSSRFRINLSISKLKKEEINKIDNLVKKMWDWEDVFSYVDKRNRNIHASGEGSFNSCLTDEEFARELAESVWKKIKRFVPVNVTATCLENLPYEEYDFDEDRYEDWKNED